MLDSPPAPPPPLGTHLPIWRAMCWNEWKNKFPIFAIFTFWVLANFVYKFQVFLTDEKCKINFSKDLQCSETKSLVYWVFSCNFQFYIYDQFCIQQCLTVNWGLKRFLRSWFRNANQWYPRTSWPRGFKPKASMA